METLDLKTKKREKTGNGFCRTLRREGLVPAVLYGPGKEPISLTVVERDLQNILKKAAGRQVILNLLIDNGSQETRKAMIKDLQENPLSRNILHADFYEIALDRPITVEVAVAIKGSPRGVEEEGGLLAVIRHALEVRCLPLDIPPEIEVDVSEMGIGDAFHLLDVVLPEGVEFPDTSVNFTLATVTAPAREEVEEEVEEEEGEGEEGAAEGGAEEGEGGKAEE